MPRAYHLCLLLALLLPASLHPAPGYPLGGPGCFENIHGVADCIDPATLPFWQANGGLAVFGYPLTPLLPDETADGLVPAQQFERNRLELHPQNPPPYDVLLGRLGADRLAQLGRGPEPPAAPRPGCRFFAETGHNVCGELLAFWESHGLEFGDPGVSDRERLALQGLPLGEARVETNSSGDTVPTQWFERVRLEDHGALAGRPLVLAGRLNAEIMAARVPAAPAPGPVAIAGDQLRQSDQPVALKGLNYYPAAHPWARMWTEWDGPLVDRDLARARRELGINVIRVLVPYADTFGWTDGAGAVDQAMLGRLRELVQIAGSHQLKVIVTLFDWHDGVAPAGSESEQAELRYLRTIVAAFKDDDRLLAWDLHNEPDNYGAWRAGDSGPVIDWLGRMALAVREIDALHPVTVGVARPESLWVAGPGGQTLERISDLVSVHSYDAARLAGLAAELRPRTAKPILLEEFGWPSGPDCRGRYFDQGSQLYLFREAARALKQPGLVGGLSWWLQDAPAATGMPVDENGHFGLYDRHGAPKPAVGPFRAVHVPALPSRSSSSLPLSKVDVAPLPPEHAPEIFDDGLVILGEFSYFWRRFGGEAMFGRPLALAYLDEQGVQVQYFERARFELVANAPRIFPGRNHTTAEYLQRIRLTPLGRQAAADRSFPPVADPRQPGVLFVPETGHTIRGAFLRRWEEWGAAFFGPPLSEEVTEQIGGQQTRVQYFTFWRFELSAAGEVRLAALGAEALRARQCPRP